MIPEGLEWASADEILNDIAGVGYNYIRMYVCCVTSFSNLHVLNIIQGVMPSK